MPEVQLQMRSLYHNAVFGHAERPEQSLTGQVCVQEPSVRQQCSGMMLQFILDYPLGARRLQHHLQFLITNLSFEHESGRQAAVDTIKVCVITLRDNYFCCHVLGKPVRVSLPVRGLPLKQPHHSLWRV